MALGAASARAFVHPGIPFTLQDINQLKAHVANGDAPWAGAYASFSGLSQSSLSYTGSPAAVISRAPDLNLGQFRSDMTAIYNLTWMWLFTNNSAYAQKATDLLDAWAVTNTYFGGDEACLELGDYSEKLVPAADILKAMYPGWTAANTAHVNAWFTNILWPVADIPNPVRGANQGAIQLKIAMSLSAYLDDTTKWNQTLAVYRDDAAGGLANSLSNGELGDTGRDDGHWIGQLQALTWSAEVAWKQGVDMYSELNNRLLAASELWCAWSLGQTLPPFIPSGGAYQFNYPGAYANGTVPNIRQSSAYNMIENAYVRRLGLTSPNTTAIRAIKGDDDGTFLFLKSADASTATQLPAIIRPASAPATNLTVRDVGDVGLAGNASYDSTSGVWTVTGAGADIPVPPLTSVDAFNFAFQQTTGDAVIVARVTSQQEGRAGVMIRESLAPDAKYVGIFLNSSGGAVATWRGATGWNKTNVSWNNPPGGYQGAAVPPAPWWFKMERLGTRVHILHSPDGVNWTGIQSAEIAALPSTAFIGLCNTSQNPYALSSATFDHVSITPSGPTGAPVITSPTAATATAGTAFNYTTTATGNPASFGATGLPAGLAIDPATGIISGTPTTPGTSLVTVSATNGSGTSFIILALSVLNNGAPMAPTGVAVTAVNGYDINITWAASAHATSYTVKRSASAGGPYTTIASGISGTSFIDTTAPSGSNYYVVTALAGSAESVPSNVATIALPPAIPGKPTVVNGSGAVTLSWQSASGAVGYNIKRATVSGGPYTTIASGVAGTSYTDSGLTNGTYYYYVISSASSDESANSPEEFGLPGAKTFTWSPTAASGDWNTASNWVEGTVPTSPAILNFGASTATTLTNTITGLEVARFSFDASAPSYAITGNAITLGTEITNTSSNSQVIQVPMAINRIINSNPVGAEIKLGSLSAGSVISGPGGFITRGDHPTSFLGSNTFSGGITAYGNVLAPDVGSPHTLSFSGVGTATDGPFGTGQVTLVSAVLTDTVPYVVSGSSGLRNVLYNNISITTGTQNVITTGGGGGVDHYGKLLGGGRVEVAGWNAGWTNYAGSPVFFGDNSGFTGTFYTLTHSSFQRLGFETANSGSAQAKFSIGNNINATQSVDANVSFGEFSGAGALRGGSYILTVGELNTDSTWAGVMSGGLGLTKKGTGVFTISFANTFGGPTTVTAGTLRILTPGAITSPVTVNSGAVLGGDGSTSSTVSVATGGTFVPGFKGQDIFTASGGLTMATGSTFAYEFNSSSGTGAGVTTPQATLNNATLTISDIVPGSLPLGTALTLINNTGASPVTGTFNGLAEGAEVTVGSNTFIITYRGGDGNDVKLQDKRTAALPSAPTGLAATAPNAFQANLTWNASPSQESVSTYTVKRATTAGGPYTTLGTVNTTTYSDSTVTYNKTYYYVVGANNYLGTGPNSTEVSVTTPLPDVPPAPSNLIVAVGDNKISLSWSAAFTAESYNVLRATSVGGPYTTIATGVTGTTYTDTTAVNGTSYYYVVVATNITGSSPNSTPANGTPTAGGYSYWPFNESSGTGAADVWGARNATLNSANVTRVAGVSGNGLHFDGTSTSYATLPAGVVSSLTGDFTISAWVKFDALQNNQRILDFGSSTTNYLFISQNSATSFRYGIRIGSGEQGITTAAFGLAASKWVHVAVTMSGSTTSIYINGALAATPSTAIVNRPSGVTATLNYFGKSQFNDPLLKGTLDDVRIYTRALNATEISGIVSALTPAAPTVLSAVAATGGVAPVSLTWTASPQATTYTVKRSTIAGGPYTVVSSNLTGTSYNDTTAANGSYYYVVTANTGAFESVPSNEAYVQLIPAVVPSSPGPIATGWNKRIDLSWAPAGGAANYDVKRATTSGGPYTTVATIATGTPLFYSDVSVTNGTPYYYVISASNAAGSSANSIEASAIPVNNPEAEVWTHADIGAVGISGNAGFLGGTYTIYGSGADIYTQVDSFHYLYKSLTGDGAIMARVVTQSTTAETAAVAKAGVMIRESITGVTSRVAEMGHRPDNVSEFIWRTASNVNAAASTSTGVTLPRWLKVIRSGNAFTAFHSADGLTWTAQGTAQTLAMTSNTYVGLVFCAAANTKRGQATFDHVSVASALPAITSSTSASATVGVPFSYTITGTNSPSFFTATGLPAGFVLNDATGVISGTPAGVGAGNYSVTLTAFNAMGASSPATFTLSIMPSAATISLSNLAQTYDGTPKTAIATTNPSGLSVNITYNGSAVAPTAAGAYNVVAALSDTVNYTAANATGILVISKAAAVPVFGNLNQVYDGTSKLPGVTTVPSGLTVVYTDNGLPVVIASGSGTLSAYAAATGHTLYISATGATDGVGYGDNTAGYAINSSLGTTAVHAGVLSSGQTAVLKVSILSDMGSYTGSTQHGVTTLSATAANGSYKIIGIADPSEYSVGPVTAGAHTIVAEVVDFNYSGTATATLAISQLAPVLTWAAPSAITYGTALTSTQLNASANVPGTFVYTPAAGTVLNVGADQTLSATFTPTDAVNCTTAVASTTITVNQATAVVGLSNLSQVYDGTAKTPTVTTTPAGLPVNITYNGTTTAPINVGSYLVTASVSDPNYTGSTTGTLTITQATAVVTLSGLQQLYTGSPRTVTATTVPAGLQVAITYNGSATAPTYPGVYPVVATINDVNYTGTVSGSLNITTTALVRHAPTLNGDVDGSVQMLLGENVTFNSGAGISNDLLVPGTPTVQINGSPVYGGAIDGPGSVSPRSYGITLNNGALLSHLVRRIDALSLPTVAAPPAPTGTRNVTLDTSSQSVGDFTTVKNLTLNSNVGAVVVPPGTYGSFTANSGSSFVLGVAGATQPAVYNFQGLTLNSNTSVQVVGPVIVTVATGMSANGNLGATDHPLWLILRFASGGLTLNSGTTYGSVIAPSGTVSLGGSARIYGSVVADRLTLNNNTLLSNPAAQ